MTTKVTDASLKPSPHNSHTALKDCRPTGFQCVVLFYVGRLCFIIIFSPTQVGHSQSLPPMSCPVGTAQIPCPLQAFRSLLPAQRGKIVMGRNENTKRRKTSNTIKCTLFNSRETSHYLRGNPGIYCLKLQREMLLQFPTTLTSHFQFLMLLKKIPLCLRSSFFTSHLFPL